MELAGMVRIWVWLADMVRIWVELTMVGFGWR